MFAVATDTLSWLLWDFLLQARTYYSTILVIATSLDVSSVVVASCCLLVGPKWKRGSIVTTKL